MVVPPSIVPTTRLRRSAEYGFAMPAGLLPADSLNHIRDAMGIPDSAFPGNAIVHRLRWRAPCSGSLSPPVRRRSLLAMGTVQPGNSAIHLARPPHLARLPHDSA